jgi:hypothetical protein
MAVSSLVALLDIHPDAVPVPVDWDSVESWLGLRLPSDYKTLVTRYGPLDIGEQIWLQTPSHQDGQYAYDYATWLRQTHRHCRVVSRDAPPFEPPEFHPAPGGLLAWGWTRGANYLFWDTGASPDPDQWPVVAFDHDAVHAGVVPWQRYEMPLAEMLSAAIRTGLPLPRPDRSLGPLPATARRTASLTHPIGWTPPPPRPEVVPERRAALTEGAGLPALRLLVPPPDIPYLGGGTWQRLFDKLGTRLPAEYVSLMNTYGAGCWRKWLRFYSPLRVGQRTFTDHVAQDLDAYRSLRDEFPEYFSLAIWPEAGGLLPFASSIEGDVIGWLTAGEPDAWPVIVHPRHADQGPPLDDDLTTTLVEWVRGRISVHGLPGLDPLDDPLEFADFEPWDDEAYW